MHILTILGKSKRETANNEIDLHKAKIQSRTQTEA